MNEIIKLSVNGDQVQVLEDIKLLLRSLFSGCRVNFLLGAGFSAHMLGTLGNYEIIFEKLRHREAKTQKEHSKIIVLSAYLYWSFYKDCIYPIHSISSELGEKFKQYEQFGNALYKIFSQRGNPALDRQFNIFTTNYDPLLELIFDHSPCICNDGFEGRIKPYFSTDNYSKTYYRQAVFSNRKAEIPSVNVFKLHGSITWSKNHSSDRIEYIQYDHHIQNFERNHAKLFDNNLLEQFKSLFNQQTDGDDTISSRIDSIMSNQVLESQLHQSTTYQNFIKSYKNSFLIVNPTKEKFSDTLLNKNYYELLRIFSNELEKENSLLLVYGFSFRDEHILDLVKRSMLNPSLKIVIFAYQEKTIDGYRKLFGQVKNSNITYITLGETRFLLEYLTQILSHVHS